ncbi:DNA photolyase [Candidatus Sumerlaeota bacterium]|nr:DNA photolyase [Candidatus Sumerlaeota bacterium]
MCSAPKSTPDELPNPRIWPRTLLVHKAARPYGLAQHIIQRWKHGPIEEIDDPQAVIDRINAGPDPLTEGKRHLLLTRWPARFIKPCQGIVESATCCNYQIINIAQNCNLECTYCILQAYLNNPLLVQYANIEDLMQELRELASANPDQPYRIGTGELTDSLALDPLTGVSAYLAEAFRTLKQCVIEFKTKTNHVEHLLAMDDPPPNTIVGFSMNAPEIARREELKTATLQERIDAAAKLQAKGFQLAFHFDPLIWHDGWRENYRAVIQQIFSRIDPEKHIAWISLGAFRYPRSMKRTIRERFPGSTIITGEFVPGFDGKMRYFLPLRVELYRTIIGFLREVSPNLTHYLCMESQEVWRLVYDDPPENNEALDARLGISCGCRTNDAAHCRAAARGT